MTQQRANLSYRDIKRLVLDRIQSRIWAPDSYLPSEALLAEEFDSTRTTVNRALRELAEEGLLERKRKTGTKVLDVPVRHARLAVPLIRDEITSTGAAYRYFLVSSNVMDAPGWLSAHLDLNGESKILHVACVHYADDKPYQFEDRWVVIDSVPDILEADFSTISPNEWLVKSVPFSSIDLTFSAVRAEKKIAEFLGAVEGDPLFTVERKTWLVGSPVTYAKLYHVPGYRMTSHSRSAAEGHGLA